jgi:uncharacterized protein YukE
MSIISIDISLAFETSAKIKGSASELEMCLNNLRTQWAGLSDTWDGFSKYETETEIESGLEKLRILTLSTNALGLRLNEIAKRFQNADDNPPTPIPGIVWSSYAASASLSFAANPNIDPGFDGLEKPIKAEYRKIDGEPFIKDDGEDHPAVNPNDISQGAVGDCYFISSLAAMAQAKPEIIENMIQKNEDGTYKVFFYEKRNPLFFWEPEFKKVEITIDNEFPVYLGTDDPVFADNNSGDRRELWPMIIEKAYAKWKGGYAKIEGGFVADGLEMITGKSSNRFSPGDLTIEKLAEYQTNGYAIGADSLSDLKLGPIDIPDSHDNNSLYQNDKLYTNHSYYVTAVNTEKGTVTVRNPWGWSDDKNYLIEVSFEDFKKSFNQVAVNQPG